MNGTRAQICLGEVDNIVPRTLGNVVVEVAMMCIQLPDRCKVLPHLFEYCTSD